MIHLEEEIKILKSEVSIMFALVHAQMEKAFRSLADFDKDLAHEVLVTENRVNAHELKIDYDCENFLALYQPVAIDLRYILAVLKINSNLERTGDIAEGVARFLVETEKQFDKELLDNSGITKMFEIALNMLDDIEDAFNDEDTAAARSIFKQDDTLDKIYMRSQKIITEYIRQHPENLEQALYILRTVQKLERVGDHAKNIAEEIIFYLEAKVIKHSEKKK
ncbi:MAG: phosphate signaling complex protein PhoU [Bacteroidia bacterium]